MKKKTKENIVYRRHGRSLLTTFAVLFMLSVTSCKTQGVTSSFDTVNEPAAKEENAVSTLEESDAETDVPGYADGEYQVDITMEGGSGKAYIHSPVSVNVKDSKYTATFIWSSANYDYMIVDGIRYDNENPGGESTFTVAIPGLDDPLEVIGDTVAMSKPHEIEYTIFWNGQGAGTDEDFTDEKSPDSVFKSNSKYAQYEGDLGSLKYTGEIKLSYAEGFRIKKYGDYRLISIADDADYLVIPEDEPVPDDIPDDIIILKRPLNRVYLVSSSAMDLIRQSGSLDHIRLSALKGDDWYLDEVKEAMDKKSILYAGKYSTPDYELILSEGCDLAIENTMIYHKPEVKEKLMELGIPVMVEQSSYEPHPLGRLEWIRLYGTLFDCEDTADKYYSEQLKLVEPIMQMDSTGVKVAFFSVTDSGMINVKKPDDYTVKMIELAGGEYFLKQNDENDDAPATSNMQMEDFYAKAYDADVLIYNSTISGEISGIDELVGKNELFGDLKAVKEKNVYCTGRDLFQKTTGMTDFIRDMHAVFAGEDTEYRFLRKLQ